MNMRDLCRNSGECQGGSREYGAAGSPKFARVRQTSHEGAHMLLLHPGTCLNLAIPQESLKVIFGRSPVEVKRTFKFRAELKVTHLR